jgi:hypothetical protein
VPEEVVVVENNQGKWKKILLKALYVQITFLILHYSYDFFPSPITKIFSGTSEAVFQHMKIGFYSYGLVSLIEFFLRKKRAANLANYGFARIGATVLYCWPMFILFFTPPAYYGKYETILAEIVSANIILYLTTVIVIVIERQFEGVSLSKEFRITMVVLFIILVSLFTIYTYRDPWFDVFEIPPGWG